MSLDGAYEDLEDNSLEVRHRRLQYRCCYGGTQEIDLILAPFAEKYLTGLDGAQIEKLEALLACPDPDLLDWIVNGITPPPEHDHDVMHLLRGFCAAQHRGRQ